MNYESSGLSASDVALLQRNNDNDGLGSGNGWWIILFLIVLFGGWGNRGFGGFGGNNGTGSTSVYEGYVLNNDFSQLSKQISDTYNMTDRKFDGLSNGLCSLGYQELQNINSVNTNLFNGFANVTSAITTNGYETRNAITQDTIANMQNTNAITSQIASCCCDIKGIAKDNRYENAQNINLLNNSINSGFVALQQSNCLNTRDIIENQNANYRALHDEIVANRIEDKNNQIAMLQNQLNNAELRASQEGQTREIINTIRPCPIPAYQSCNPWGCNCNNNSCGCGM